MENGASGRDAAGDALGMTGQPAPPHPPAGWLPVAWDAGDRRLICRDGERALRSWYGGPRYLPPVGLRGWAGLGPQG